VAIDTAERRKSVSGIPLLIPGVTNNATPDREWRQESGWSYGAVAGAGLPAADTQLPSAGHGPRKRAKTERPDLRPPWLTDDWLVKQYAAITEARARLKAIPAGEPDVAAATLRAAQVQSQTKALEQRARRADTEKQIAAVLAGVREVQAQHAAVQARIEQIEAAYRAKLAQDEEEFISLIGFLL
jgi:hypothetical protein